MVRSNLAWSEGPDNGEPSKKKRHGRTGKVVLVWPGGESRLFQNRVETAKLKVCVSPTSPTMASTSRIEELSSSDDDSLDFNSAEEEEEEDSLSDRPHDPLADYEKVDGDAERQARDAASAGSPIDMSTAFDPEEKKEEPLIVEELPEEEVKEVRRGFR